MIALFMLLIVILFMLCCIGMALYFRLNSPNHQEQDLEKQQSDDSTSVARNHTLHINDDCDTSPCDRESAGHSSASHVDLRLLLERELAIPDEDVLPRYEFQSDRLQPSNSNSPQISSPRVLHGDDEEPPSYDELAVFGGRSDA